MSNLKSSCRQHHWFIAALNANKSVFCVFFCLLSLFSFNSEKPKLWIIIRRICAVICLRQFIEFMLLIWKRRKKIVFKFTFGFKFGFGWWCWFHKETTRQSLFSSLSTHKMAQNHFLFFRCCSKFQMRISFQLAPHICIWLPLQICTAPTDSAHLVYMRRAIIRFNKVATQSR